MSLDAETMSIVEVMLERIERLESRAVENKWFDAWIWRSCMPYGDP